jgi:hypothetical protein
VDFIASVRELNCHTVYVEANKSMVVNSKYEKRWKEAVMACLKILPRHLPRGIEKNH